MLFVCITLTTITLKVNFKILIVEAKIKKLNIVKPFPPPLPFPSWIKMRIKKVFLRPIYFILGDQYLCWIELLEKILLLFFFLLFNQNSITISFHYRGKNLSLSILSYQLSCAILPPGVSVVWVWVWAWVGVSVGVGVGGRRQLPSITHYCQFKKTTSELSTV